MSSMLHCYHCHLEHVIHALSTCITKSGQNLVGDNSHTLQDAWQNPNAAAVYGLFRYTIIRKNNSFSMQNIAQQATLNKLA